MAIKTKIEYCDSTANPVMGCSGCELYSPDPKSNHCYANTLCTRYAGRAGWPKSFTNPEYFLYRWEDALRWSDLTGTDRPDKPWLNGSPRVIFVNDLSDGFCPDVSPDVWLTPYIERLADSPHIWLLLTKWPERMVRYFSVISPVPNIWLGTTVTSQRKIDRLYELTKLDANLWLSAEPLLSAIDIFTYLIKIPEVRLLRPGDSVHTRYPIQWVCLGAESGQNARPMHPTWARSPRDICTSLNVPFFFKQWGEWLHISHADEEIRARQALAGPRFREASWQDDTISVRVGKSRAGRTLDGIIHSEMPNFDNF